MGPASFGAGHRAAGAPLEDAIDVIQAEELRSAPLGHAHRLGTCIVAEADLFADSAELLPLELAGLGLLPYRGRTRPAEEEATELAHVWAANTQRRPRRRVRGGCASRRSAPCNTPRPCMRRRTHAQTHACGAGVRMAQPCTTAARDHVRSCGAHVKHDASSLKKRFGSPPTSFT